MRVWENFLTERDKKHLAAGWCKQTPFGLGENLALVIVDNFADSVGDPGEDPIQAVQKSSVRFGAESWEAVQHTNQLLNVARRCGIVIVHTTMVGFSIDRGIMGRVGCQEHQFHPDNMPEAGELVIVKFHASAFLGTSLDAQLRTRGVDTVLICGNSTSGCVRATVVDAAGLGFHVGIVEECIFDRTEASHAMSLFDMDQKYADVISLEKAMSHVMARTSEVNGVVA